MRILHRIDRTLAYVVGEWLFLAGYAFWLANAIAGTTVFWLWLPNTLSVLVRYVALAMIVAWYLVDHRVNPLTLVAFVALAGIVFLLTRSTRLVKYSVIALIPLSDILSSGRRPHASELVTLVASLFLMVVAANAESPRLMDLSILILAARGYPFRRIALVSLVVTTVVVSLVFVASAVGVVGDYAMAEKRFRYFMGFGYALYPSRYLFIITCLALYLSDSNTSVLEVGLLLVANLVVYRMTDSRLAFFSAVLIVLVAVIHRLTGFNPLKLKAVRYGLVACVPLSVAAALLLAYCYQPSIGWMSALNGALGGRLSLGHNALQELGVPLLGQRVELVGKGLVSLGNALPTGAYNYIDSLYVQLAVIYGPVILLLYTVLQTLVMQRACKEGLVILVAVLLLFSLQGMLDDAAISIQYNTFLFLISGVVGSKVQPAAVSPEASGLERPDESMEVV